MKRVWQWGMAVLILAVACGAVSFWAARNHLVEKPHGTMLLDDLPELEWVRKEFGMTDEQLARVRELHVAYRPICVEMCNRIREARDKITATARSHGAMSPELEGAIRNHAKVYEECQRSMLTHLYETAAVLEENQGRRYLDAMLPYALDFKHDKSEGEHAQ